VFDKHNDGMINIEEVMHVLTRIGDPIQKEEMQAFIN